jgi:predicted ATPase/DNA-binding winged helix-turn-helix (wHTH) protein
MAKGQKRQGASPPGWGKTVRIDLQREVVWRGEVARRLTPKAFAVLRYLVTHPGRVVTRDELWQAVWPGLVVGEAALNVCIRELRQALGDDPQAPQFIETVHRRGYRFIGPEPDTGGGRSGVGSPAALPSVTRRPVDLVGREAELRQLQGWLAQAQGGTRQVAFVTGEPGIGKTTVVDAFLASLAPDPSLWVAWGQCLEHYGVGEAYLPVLAALGQLCRAPGGERLIALLGQYAPTWLVQLPALLSATELEALQRRVQGATPERMLREMAEALEALTAERTLVFVLEDLHWSDHATLDLLAYLAQRREPARLLLLGTYRPVEVIVRRHPLRAVTQALALHRQCVELPVEGLREAAVAAYLVARWGDSPVVADLARVLHRRTDGHPLFMVTVADWWAQPGWVAVGVGQGLAPHGLEALAEGVPESLRQLIEHQLEGLSPEEQRLLEAASVAGVEFSAAAVAAGVEAPVVEVEERCEVLRRRGQFLQACGEEAWPDGTVAGRYGFCHALYPEVLYHRLSVGRRLQLHRRIGERAEAGYGARAAERAAELAVHFERGQDDRRAVRYHQHAAENARRRWAYREMIDHLTTGLARLHRLPEIPERHRQELDMQLALASALMATEGQAAPDVAHAYARARVLCPQLGDEPALFPALIGLHIWSITRGDLSAAHAIGEQLLARAHRAHDPTVLLVGHLGHGVVGFLRGEFTVARAHLDQSRALYDPRQHQGLLSAPAVQAPGPHPMVGCLTFAAYTLWYLGFPDQALRRSQEALHLGHEVSHPYSVAFAGMASAVIHQLRHEIDAAQEQLDAVVSLATAQGFAQFVTTGTILRGWVRVAHGQATEGMAQMHQGLAVYGTMGAEAWRSYYRALLAEGYAAVGHADAGLKVLAEALASADATGTRFYEAELSRLRGELLLSPGAGPGGEPATPAAAEAETCFQQALSIARRQQAMALELRAAMSLTRLWQQQGKRAEARQLLAPIYGWFTEGFETADLQEAKGMLDQLSGAS